jgi:hypothetical protein
MGGGRLRQFWQEAKNKREIPQRRPHLAGEHIGDFDGLDAYNVS